MRKAAPTTSLSELRVWLNERCDELLESIPAPERPVPLEEAGLKLGKRHARLLDTLLETLFEGLSSGSFEGDPAHPVEPSAWSEVALAGVGGYGRGAVALKSDLDVRLLASRPDHAAAVARALLYPLWDMGVSIGHQVVSIDELLESARDDLPTATSLLDWRHVAGNKALSDSLRARAYAGIFAYSELPRFYKRLEEELEQRHARFGGSVYLLEPDVKNGEGGLRDADIFRWTARARYRAGEPDELLRIGALSPREAVAMQQASERLWRIRNLLHAHAGRRSDRLTFDEQEAVAAAMAYGEGGEAVERMMSETYRSARIISRSVEMMLTRAKPILSPKRPRDEDLGGGMRLFDGYVSVSEVNMLRADPTLALRVVAEAARRRVPLLAFARDAIASLASDTVWSAELRANKEAGTLFAKLISTCEETALKSGSVARELHDLGLLLAMIPAFGPVVGRVHHDTYHVYTVDVHSVAAVDRLASLARGDLAAEFPLASRLAAEIPRPRMLFFATLLHDVGKAIGGHDHSQRGAEMAREILTRIGLRAEDVEEACHLIRTHLLMYHVATRRDLDDPATIEEFAREVHGREGLRSLYLLTVADLSTTSPTSMTSWKARMLDELYFATEELFLGERGARMDERKARAIKEVEGAAAAWPLPSETAYQEREAFLARYLESMPERYLLANAPEAIVAHAELARGHDGREISLSLVPSRHPEAAEICVIAADRPGLLAAITAAIAASRLEVHAAEINSRSLDPMDPTTPLQAVDLFWVRDRGDGVAGVERSIPKLLRDIEAVLVGKVEAAELAKLRGGGQRFERPSPKVRIQVAVDDRASPRYTVIEVVARDRPGLLFALSDALYRLGLTIAVAKINTEGTKVADVFYVSEADGRKVAPGKRSQEIQARLFELLEGLEPDKDVRNSSRAMA